MTQKLHVCVLQSSTEGSTAELSQVDPYRKPEAYDTKGEYEWTHAYIRKATSAAQLTALAASGAYDVYLNLCDGAWDEDRAGLDVVHALERFNLPYTGANPAFYEPTKVEMKMAVQYYDVPVPAWVLIQSSSEGPDSEAAGLAAILAPPEAGGMRFPLIVKHPSGYSSVGMSRQSKVSNEEELREQVSLLLERFGGALIEEFVEGQEFTVLVVEQPPPTASEAAADGAIVTPPLNGTLNGADGAPLHHQETSSSSSALSQSSQSDDKVNGKATALTASAAAAVGTMISDDVTPALDPDFSFRPVAYEPIQVDFAPGEDFKHFDLKWMDYGSCGWRTSEDRALVERLKDAAVRTFVATRGVSYGRCDFRVDAAGNIYLLEINPNCGILYAPHEHGSADAILAIDPTTSHAHFLATIFASALARHRLKQPKYKPVFFRRPRPLKPPSPPPLTTTNGSTHAANDAYRNGACDGAAAAAAAVPSRAAVGDWGLVATRAIRAGEVVQRNEQRPHTLASRGFVRRCWPEGSRQRQWFDEYAYGISDEVWITWSDDPNRWAPLNHSCDPNTWLVGMDAVARRDIAPGEQLTVDYATYNVDHMAPFDCECGSSCCRRRVTGTDYLLPWLRERYGDHISAYVAQKRRRAGLDT